MFVSYVQAGPVGGIGGDEVPPWAMPSDGTIVRIEVKWGDYVNQLLFHYTSPSSGQGVISLGGYDSGSHRVDISLQEGQEIVALSGNCGDYLDSVTIAMRMPASGVPPIQEYGPYGGPGGEAFAPLSVPDGGRFAGLFGRAGQWVDALGVVYAMLPSTAPHA